MNGTLRKARVGVLAIACAVAVSVIGVGPASAAEITVPAANCGTVGGTQLKAWIYSNANGAMNHLHQYNYTTSTDFAFINAGAYVYRYSYNYNSIVYGAAYGSVGVASASSYCDYP